MKKLLLLAALFLVTLNAFADDVCLNVLTCDYQAGTCTGVPGWTLNPYNAEEKFDKLSMNVSKITASGLGTPVNDWYVNCVYKYGDHSSFIMSRNYLNLTGNAWIYSGFANSNAVCSDLFNLNNCSFKN